LIVAAHDVSRLLGSFRGETRERYEKTLGVRLVKTRHSELPVEGLQLFASNRAGVRLTLNYGPMPCEGVTNLQVELNASRSHPQIVCSRLRIAIPFK
jgi:hypothetical protein